jgi:hypothetical protein
MLNQELRELIQTRSEVRFGYSRPDWDGVRADVQLAGGDFAKLATGAARMWMDQVSSEFGKGAKVIVEGRRTYALLPASEAAVKAQVWVERCLNELRVLLAGIVREEDDHLVVLLFDDRAAFVSYDTDFFAEGGEEDDEIEELAQGSSYYWEGFPQIVAPVYEGVADTGLAHCLTSSMLQHLPLPAWLYSGILQSMTGLLTNRDMQPSSREMTAARRGWNAETIQAFWSGASFSDDYLGRPAQTMAFLFVQALSGSYERLVRLVTSSDLSMRDSGNAAFQAEYGHGLENLAARLLGAGAWAPDAAAIAQSQADIEAEFGDDE